MLAVEFGSLLGSQYRKDKGECQIPKDLVRYIAGLKLKPVRSRMWFIGFIIFGLMLLTSIGLQVLGATVATIGSESMGIAILLLTSVLRGAGVAGPEAWQIPSRRRRHGASNATLVGKYHKRR